MFHVIRKYERKKKRRSVPLLARSYKNRFLISYEITYDKEIHNLATQMKNTQKDRKIDS